jgi:hypothetical protein
MQFTVENLIQTGKNKTLQNLPGLLAMIQEVIFSGSGDSHVYTFSCVAKGKWA